MPRDEFIRAFYEAMAQLERDIDGLIQLNDAQFSEDAQAIMDKHIPGLYDCFYNLNKDMRSLLSQRNKRPE